MVNIWSSSSIIKSLRFLPGAARFNSKNFSLSKILTEGKWFLFNVLESNM